MISKYFQNLLFLFRNSKKLDQKQDIEDTSVSAVLCAALAGFRRKSTTSVYLSDCQEIYNQNL